MERRAARYAPWLIVIALLAAAAALHARTALAATSPEQALRAAIEAQGQQYAGDCASTVSPRDIGKVCSRPVGEQNGTRAYLAGRTFSEFSRWLFVAPDAGQWRVVSEAQLRFDATSPEIPWP